MQKNRGIAAVAIFGPIPILGLYDLGVGQLASNPENWIRLKDIGGLLPWYGWVTPLVLVAIVSLFEGGFRASRARDNTIGELRGTNEIPKNRDALIAAFTELGKRAGDLLSNRKIYHEIGDKYGEERKLRLLEAIGQALHIFDEAELAARKEVNIVGGELAVVLRSVTLLIHFQPQNYKAETEEPVDSHFSDIAAYVEQAIEAINRGNRPISLVN